MIYIYGLKKTKIKSITDLKAKCEHCGKLGLKFHVFQEYYHFFWIPFLPNYEKNATATCENCGNTSYSEKRKTYANNTKKPIWLYSGVILFVSFISFIIVVKALNGTL